MGICRDCFGKLSYTMTNTSGNVFSVRKGENRIMYHRPYVSGVASVFIDTEMAFWDETPRFDSFIKAVAYMKRNIEYLL